MTPEWLRVGAEVAKVVLLQGRPVSFASARVVRRTPRVVYLSDGDSFWLGHVRDSFLLRPDKRGPTWTRLSPAGSRSARRAHFEVARRSPT